MLNKLNKLIQEKFLTHLKETIHIRFSLNLLYLNNFVDTNIQYKYGILWLSYEVSHLNLHLFIEFFYYFLAIQDYQLIFLSFTLWLFKRISNSHVFNFQIILMFTYNWFQCFLLIFIHYIHKMFSSSIYLLKCM